MRWPMRWSATGSRRAASARRRLAQTRRDPEGTMAADRSYIAENDRERRRLEALVEKLDDAALSRAMPAGWTVAAVLAHLAFWDQRTVTVIELVKRGGRIAAIDEA